MGLNQANFVRIGQIVLFRPDKDAVEDAYNVQGCVHTFRFHKPRLEGIKADIKAMLDELPLTFQKDGGGGWSFLNMCETKHGKQWTSLHLDMELLCCMAIATKQGRFMFDREVWSALPGGMPYFVVGDYE